MLSRDEILANNAAGSEAVAQLIEASLATQAGLHQQVTRLTARVAELETRLNKDSHNSYKRRASDGLAKKEPRPTVCTSTVAREAARKSTILGSP